VPTDLTMLTASTLTTEQVLAILLDPLQPASRFLAAGPGVFDSPTGAPLLLHSANARAVNIAAEMVLSTAIRTQQPTPRSGGAGGTGSGTRTRTSTAESCRPWPWPRRQPGGCWGNAR
jgi:hypothetical protein